MTYAAVKTLIIDPRDEDRYTPGCELTLSEAKEIWEEMHFHNDLYLDEVLRAAATGDEDLTAAKIYKLNSARIGEPDSIGGDYDLNYFTDLADFILANEGSLMALNS